MECENEQRYQPDPEATQEGPAKIGESWEKSRIGRPGIEAVEAEQAKGKEPRRLWEREAL